MFIRSKEKISKEDFLELQKLHDKFKDYVINVANNSQYPPCAYGFCSPQLFEYNGEFYVSWEHWDSCD